MILVPVLVLNLNTKVEIESIDALFQVKKMSKDDWITLNVGGQKFSTCRSVREDSGLDKVP